MFQHDSWQKSSYCGSGDSCVNVAATWQTSSYCGEGEACVHVAAPAAARIQLTESSDPAEAILTTTPAAFQTLLHTLKNKEPHRG